MFSRPMSYSTNNIVSEFAISDSLIDQRTTMIVF